MCGIAGIIAGRAGAAPVQRMTQVLRHRGPDDEGLWLDPEQQVVLGHRRLSIIDLSAFGHQPMESSDGRWVISYNGEIYNHAALRIELEEAGGGPSAHGLAWRGHSDTETLIEAIAYWGLACTLEKCVGMFAIGLWDKKERELHLARDRFGEKPLYYGWVGGDFLFASELKALRVHPGFDNGVSRHALRLMSQCSYVPAPLSIYERIYKLEPGCILSLGTDVWRQVETSPPPIGTSAAALRLTRYWSYRDLVLAGLENPFADKEEAMDELERALAAAITGQAVADVDVGAFLSGGIDSSTVVALYKKYSPGRVRTFTIGFEQAEFNEADHAREVARHFGTEHYEKVVTVAETRNVIPLLPAMYDEPFADASQIPTYLVSKFAREHVTVALSGDGGDELFGGYNRYLGATSLWSQLRTLPRPVRRLVGRALGQVPPTLWNGVFGLMPGGKRQPHFGTKVQKTLATMGWATSLDDVHDSFVNDWSNLAHPVLGGAEGVVGGERICEGAPDAVRMMFRDAVSYLPDDVLCKVDRAAMAVSLETRVPYLDHRLAAVAARIPVGMKIRSGRGKLVLRDILYREAPNSLFERPKTGFAVPVGEWVRGPLRDWAEDLLSETRLRQEGYFDAEIVRRRWQAHLSGRSDSAQALWSLLMFQAWQTVSRSQQMGEAA